MPSQIPDDARGRVSARLKLARTLIEHNETLADPTKIQDLPDGGWTHELVEHDALVNYLLLTCFDVLGQPADWLAFGSWLTASRTKAEREEALSDLATTDPVAIAAHIHDAYNRSYGVRRSFMNFINSHLGVEARTKLLNSIHIEEEGELVNDDNAKTAFLYGLRNAFTHEARGKGQVNRVFSPPVVMFIDGAPIYGSETIDRDEPYEYSVEWWPFTLYETIANYIGEPVPDFNVKIKMMWHDGPALGASGTNRLKGVEAIVSWSGLKNPAELHQIAQDWRDKNSQPR